MSTVNVVPTPEPANWPPRVRLNITDIGTPNLTLVTVTRLNPDGRTVVVRTNDGSPVTLTTSGANRIGLVYDYEMPYDQEVSYSTLEDPTSISEEVVVPELRPWLIHPGVPEWSMPITIKAVSERTFKVRQQVLRPWGRRYPISITDGARQAAEYKLSVLFRTPEEQDDFETLIADGGVLLFNVSPDRGWRMPTEYIGVGDVSEVRVADFLGEPYRVFDLACTVVDRPAGGTQAQRTYEDVIEDYASYAALPSAYSTYSNLLAGP